METIIKFASALILGAQDENGNYNPTRIQRIKDVLLWMLVGCGILIGCLLYFGDDEEETTDEDNIEYVEEGDIDYEDYAGDYEECD